jgi:hypothetical protein
MGLNQTKDKKSSIIPLNEILKKEPDFLPCLNIYRNDKGYKFQGVLPSDTKKFYLLFRKDDVNNLPLAISFELRDDFFLINQYHFLRPDDKPKQELENLILQFPEDELSETHSCDVSPSFPFSVEIEGEIILKTIHI